MHTMTITQAQTATDRIDQELGWMGAQDLVSDAELVAAAVRGQAGHRRLMAAAGRRRADRGVELARIAQRLHPEPSPTLLEDEAPGL